MSKPRLAGWRPLFTPRRSAVSLVRNASPFEFGTHGGGDGEAAAQLAVHAPEYRVDPDTGQWYVTSAGWTGDAFGTVIPGSVAIRELDWVG